MSDDPLALKILSLRSRIAELSGAIRQLQQSDLDYATARLLLSRKSAELEDLLNRHRRLRSDHAP